MAAPHAPPVAPPIDARAFAARLRRAIDTISRGIAPARRVDATADMTRLSAKRIRKALQGRASEPDMVEVACNLARYRGVNSAHLLWGGGRMDDPDVLGGCNLYHAAREALAARAGGLAPTADPDPTPPTTPTEEEPPMATATTDEEVDEGADEAAGGPAADDVDALALQVAEAARLAERIGRDIEERVIPVLAQVESVAARVTRAETALVAFGRVADEARQVARDVESGELRAGRDLKRLAERVAALERRPGDSDAEATLSMLADAERRVAALEAARAADLARIAALEERLAKAAAPKAPPRPALPAFEGDLPARERDLPDDVLLPLVAWMQAKGRHQALFAGQKEREQLADHVLAAPVAAGLVPDAPRGGSGARRQMLCRVGDLRAYRAMVESDDRLPAEWTKAEWFAWWKEHCRPAWEAALDRIGG